MSALTWKTLYPVRLRIWSDSTYVVDGFACLIKRRQIPQQWDNQDLWQRALGLVFLIDWDTCWICKVDAHLDPQASSGPAEDFLIAGNLAADTAAKRCNQMRSERALSLVRQMQETHLMNVRRAHAHQNFLLEIAHHDLQRTPFTTEADPEDVTLAELGLFLTDNDCSIAAIVEPCIEHSIGAVSPFEGAFLLDLSKFLFGLDVWAPYKQFVTFAELSIAFVLHLGTFPVWTSREGRSCVHYCPESPLSALTQPTLAGSAALMQKAMGVLFDFGGADFQPNKMSKPHLGVTCDLWGIEIGWSVASEVEPILSLFASSGIRHTRDLARPFLHLLR